MGWIEPDKVINAAWVTPLTSTSIAQQDLASGVSLPVTRTERPSELRNTLMRGRQQLDARFGTAPSYALRAGGKFMAVAGLRDPIYRLQKGWACQGSELRERRRAIIDVYLPGDIIGLDAPFRTRPIGDVLALSSVETKVIDADDGLGALLASECGALYVAWLLGHRQRRADRLLTAISCLDARGRLAMMVLDFYKRLRARKLIASEIYNLPLTQQQIGNYLGLTVVHVNRVLKSLRNDRIARLERNCVTILDLDRLTLLARGVSDTSSELDRSDSTPSGERVVDRVGAPTFAPAA
jgi:CRP/FNR family transcriptional regulator, anaerobic regulatory protein